MSQKDLSGRLARWSLVLQGYDFQIEHRKGTQNIVPDTLSRYQMESLTVDVEQMIDLDSEKFNTEDYKSIIQVIQEKAEQLPDL